MKRKEAEIIMYMLETIENIEELLRRIKHKPKIDRAEIYLSYLEVKKRVPIPR